MRLMSQVLVANLPTRENRINMRDWLFRGLESEFDWAIEFVPGAYMHSIGHPNFPPTEATGSGLVSPSEPPPRLRKLSLNSLTQTEVTQ
jgi:hypothetical protein